jgi:hypothetical protein
MTSFVTKVTEKTPLAWYKLNEKSGTTITDSGSAKLNGTYEGSVPYISTAQPLGGAGNIDGSHEWNENNANYGKVAAGAAFKPTNAETIAWIYPKKFGKLMGIFEHGTSGSAGNFGIAIETSGLVKITAVPSGGSLETLVGEKALTLNQWSIVYLRHNGTKIELFINEVKEGIKTMTASTIAAAEGSNFIGNIAAGSSCFNGYIGQVVCFNKVLAEENIKTLYKSGIGLSEASGEYTLNNEISNLTEVTAGLPSGKVHDHLKREVAGVVTYTLPGEASDAGEARRLRYEGQRLLIEK